MASSLSERVLLRLLREAGAPSPDEAQEMKQSAHVKALMPLAAFVYDSNGDTVKTAVLYSPEDVADLLPGYREQDDRYYAGYYSGDYDKARTARDMKNSLNDKSVAGAVRGLMQIKKSGDPCWEAWEVIGSAGPGGADIARTVYGLAYAMSPSGVVMSDRGSLSAAAKASWARVAASGAREALPLDDISLPREQRRTPDFDGDDCSMYRGKSRGSAPEKNPYLQYAYKAQGWERGMMNFLTAAHDDFKKELARIDSKLPGILEKYLRYSISTYFGYHYKGSDSD